MEQRIFDAWAAGFIDGEGYIALRRVRSKNAVRGYTHQPLISASGCVKEPLNLLQKEFGGNIGPRKSIPPQRTCWEWRVTAYGPLLAVIPRLLPYLTVKRRHAVVMLEYLSGPGTPRQGRRPLTADIFNARCKAHQRLKELNKRGC